MLRGILRRRVRTALLLEVARATVKGAASVEARRSRVHNRMDQAGVYGKAPATHQPLVRAALHHGLEQVTEQVTFAKAPVPVLGEGGVIRHLALQAETAEPS